VTFASPILAILAAVCACLVVVIVFPRRRMLAKLNPELTRTRRSEGAKVREQENKKFHLSFETICYHLGVALEWKRLREGCASKTPIALLILSLICLTLAAGSPRILRTVPARVVIMVDQSASTRGSQYRDGALVGRLQRQYDARVIEFGGDTDETVFAPPDADAILLFSDGQFDLPTYAPPVYAVIDPGLLNLKDASVSRLEFRNREIVAAVRNNTDGATLAFSTNPQRSRDVPKGATSLSDSLAMNVSSVTAQITSDDRWSENNALSIAPSPPMHLEKWWVGPGTPPQSFRAMSVSQLPSDATSYLRASVIVLHGMRMSGLSGKQVESLERYLRELGGVVILSGIDRQPGFSPVSDSPPTPERRWVILCDQSGSMAQRENDQSKFSRATASIQSLLPTLPQDDRLDIGGFARDLLWWTSGKRVADEIKTGFIPPVLEPSGPTNLEAILRELAGGPMQNLPSEILLITDAEATFADVDSLIASLRSAKSRVHLMQIGAAASPATDRLISETGGTRLQSGVDANWASQLQSLAAGAMPDRTVATDVVIEFENRRFNASMLRETWLKQGASLLAGASLSGRDFPAIAKWRVGEGTVCTLAVQSADLASVLAVREAARPRDARFRVTVDQEEFIRIRIDATDGGQYLNGLLFGARVDAQATQTLQQTAPGLYEAKLPPPRMPAILTIFKDDQAVDRIALTGRYAREFSNIGLNRDNLQRLTQSTGGRIIEPAKGDSFHILRKSPRELSPLLLSIASVSLGALLILWKLGRTI